MSELNEKTLTSLAAMVRSREVSPVELVEAHLEQIAQLNPRLNAIITVANDVLGQAERAVEQLNEGRIPGALHGVPLTIKDTIETRDIRSTSGCASRAKYIPNRDAPAVARLKQAGAIILGKTNSAEMAMDYTADNPVFGRTNNPHDVTKTPGGSSGGEAAAIATCMSAGGLGSDLAGSIRIPAHFCGIAGFKPATGHVPGGGQFPPSSGPYSLGAVIGPMARSVEDLRLLFHVLTNRAEEPSRVNVKSIRAAWYTEDGVAPVTKETRRAVAVAAHVLADAGLNMLEERPPHVERGNELWMQLFSRASVVQLRSIYAGRETEAGSFVSWRLKTADASPPPTLDEYIASWMLRDRLRAELLDWLEETPLVLAPVGATPAYEHDTLKVSVGPTVIGNFKAFSYCQTFSVFDLPVLTVPVGRSNEGLPIGVQIIARPGDEDLLFSAAQLIEQTLGGWQEPPLDRIRV